MNIKIDINNCRVCLQTGSGQPLFGEVGQFAQKFTYTTQLKATKGDGFPELLCVKCVARLKIAYEFRKQSEDSEQHLRKFIAALNTKPSSSAHDEAGIDDLEARLLAEALEGDVGDLSAESAPPQQINDASVSKSAAAVSVKMEPSAAVPAKRPAAPAAAIVTRVPSTPQRTSARNANKLLVKRTTTAETSVADGQAVSKPSIAGKGDEQEQQQPDAHVGQHFEFKVNLDVGDVAAEDEQQPQNGDGHVVEEVEVDEEEIVHEFILDDPLLDEDMKEEHLLDDDLDLADDDNDAAAAYDDDDENNSQLEGGTVDGDYNDDDDDDDYSASESQLQQQPPAKKRRRGASRMQLVRPDDITSSGNVHVCRQCNKDFSTRTNLLRHIQTHDGSKPYKCEICGSAFTQNGSLKQHMHIHTGTRPFECEFCGRGFTQSKSLTFHMRRHTGEKPFQCTECGLSFRQKDGLKRHASVRHPDGPKLEFPCDVCPKVLRSRYSLNLHRRRHDEQAALAADGAPTPAKGGAAPAKVEVAVTGKPTSVIVAGGEPGAPGALVLFKCEQCPRSFAAQASMVAHRRQHVADRDAATATQCPQCDVVCASKALLTSHLRTVHREGALEGDVDLEPEVPKPFECKECGLRFALDVHRTVHMKAVHNKRCKRFPCTRCSKAYAIKANLDAHLARHESNDLGDEPLNSGKHVFECHDCSVYFTTLSELRDHRRTDHGFDSTIEQLDEFEDDDDEYVGGDDSMDVDHAQPAEEVGEVVEVGEEEVIIGLAQDDIAIDSVKQIFECGDCNVGFTSIRGLREHRRTDHGVEELTEEASLCEACDMLFHDMADLEAHILMSHGDQVVNMVGPDIGEEATAVEEAAEEAVEAVDSNTSETSFKCDRCGEQLATQKSLDEHLLEHDLTDGK